MLIYPAIDLMDGKCVRLTRGDFKTKKKYSDDPLEVACIWKDKGASWIHIVDLDGARKGRIANLSVAADIKEKTGVCVQYGGGIREYQTIEKVLKKGIDRVILGTRAIEDEVFLREAFGSFGDSIIVSLDFGKKGIIYKKGWKEKTPENIFDLTRRLENMGMREVIVTDIERDGTLVGTDTGLLKKILVSNSMRFIIAGGISGLDDIRELKKLEDFGISGVITGKALYEGSHPMDLGEAIKAGEDIDR